MTSWKESVSAFRSIGRSRSLESSIKRTSIIENMIKMVKNGEAPKDLIESHRHPIKGTVGRNAVVAEALGLGTHAVYKYVSGMLGTKSKKVFGRSHQAIEPSTPSVRKPYDRAPKQKWSRGFQAVILTPMSPTYETYEEVRDHLRSTPSLAGRTLSVVSRHGELEIKAPQGNDIKELSAEESDRMQKEAEFSKLVKGNMSIPRAAEHVGITSNQAYGWAKRLGLKSARQERMEEAKK